MSRLAKVERFFNDVNLTSDDEVFVGVDVHKKSYHVALYVNDSQAIDFQMRAEPKELCEKLQPMSPNIKRIVYESGPTGYGLARDLIKNKLPARVVATSKIPRLAGGDDKTDKLDSMKLAEYCSKGLLRCVAIPTVKQESDRQLYRMRHKQSRQLARSKNQIKSFLLMHGIEEPKGLGHWTNASVEELRNIKLIDTLRLSLDELLSDYDYFSNRVRQLNKSFAEHLDKGMLGRRIAVLKTHPGVGPVVGCQFATELFHYKDFGSTRQLYKYLGLSPRLNQSGDRSSTGSLNKAANSRLRSNLLQAAWSWVLKDVEARKSFYRICNNCGGIRQKAIVAMARKLAGHLWSMLMTDEPYDVAKTKSKFLKEFMKTK